MSLSNEDKQWIVTAITTSESRLAGRADAAEERMKDFIRQADHDLETKIISEFWKWSRTSDMRTRQAIEAANTLSERLLAAEDRITALERKPS